MFFLMNSLLSCTWFGFVGNLCIARAIDWKKDVFKLMSKSILLFIADRSHCDYLMFFHRLDLGRAGQNGRNQLAIKDNNFPRVDFFIDTIGCKKNSGLCVRSQRNFMLTPAKACKTTKSPCWWHHVPSRQIVLRKTLVL